MIPLVSGRGVCRQGGWLDGNISEVRHSTGKNTANRSFGIYSFRVSAAVHVLSPPFSASLLVHKEVWPPEIGV